MGVRKLLSDFLGVCAFFMEPSCFGTAKKIIKILFRGTFTGDLKNSYNILGYF